MAFNNVVFKQMKEPIIFKPYDFDGEFCFINGQRGLDSTDQAIYDYLVDKSFYPLVLDELFDHPEKLIAIKYFNPSTIITGTTGVYQDKINMLKDIFTKLEWMPKYAIFTMGEEYFRDFIQLGIESFKVYPFMKSMETPMLAKLE